ncbi:MAG: glycosyltransferase family 39 protein [Nanoarchaeota archaeon]|nr:glycosyltransferase family 39 protein [Nanoarchaeota archaeon]
MPWLHTTIHKDEGHFGLLSWQFLEGEGLYIPSLDDNKPIGLYIIYSIPIAIFGNSIIAVRMLNNLLFFISIIFFFKIVEMIFSKKEAFYATLFYIFFMNIPVFEGYFALSEPLLVPFMIASIYFFQKFISTKKGYMFFISSILATFSVFIKHQSLFIFLILLGGLFIYNQKNKIRKSAIILGLPTLFFLFFLFKYNYYTMRFITSNFFILHNKLVGFASGYRPYAYNLPLLIEGSVLLLFAIIGFVIIFKTKRTKHHNFLVLWVLSAAVFSFIPPAYGHYFCMLIPPLCVLAGIALFDTINNYKKRILLIILAALLLIITLTSVSQHYPNTNLHMNHLKERWSSFNSYDSQIKLINFIKSKTDPGEKIVIIEWEPSIYWLSERMPPKNVGIAIRRPERFNYYLRTINKSQDEIELLVTIMPMEGLENGFPFLTNKTIVSRSYVFDVQH